MSVPPLLAIDALVAGYEPGLPILKGASLAVAPGEILAVLGPNGAGKSTLVKAVGGLVPVESGRLLVDGVDVTHLAAHARVARGLSFVPQTANVFAGMTVTDNLRLAADRLGAALAGRRIAALLDAFPDLAARKTLLAGRLSGGQRQMLAIARALIPSPRVLLMDEPSAGLSPRLVTDVLERLAAISRDGVAVVLVEQNVRAALAVATRAVVLVDGRARHEGPAAGLADDPVLADLFLGGRRAEARA